MAESPGAPRADDASKIPPTAEHPRVPGRMPGRMIDLGRLGYREAHDRQLAVVEDRKNDICPDTVLAVEHPHVITLGRAQKALGNVLAAGDVDVIEVERGGDVTYHGPGQLVLYPIVKLAEGERDLHRFLRNLEEAMILTLARYGLVAGREAGKTGVWLAGRKIASIGIACRRWVTFHGLALNVTTNLSYFSRINPCGFQASVMTSMAAETGLEDLDIEAVKAELVSDLGEVLGRDFFADPAA